MSKESFQFFHIEAYARVSNKDNTKQSAINAALEIDRNLDTTQLVNNVKPIRFFGCSAVEAVQRAEEIAKNATDRMGRSVRKDAAIIILGVASYPLETENFKYAKKIEKDALEKWLKLNHDFLQKKYGDRYVSNILHVDEKYFHIHFYILPTVNLEKIFDLNSAHDGISAKNNSKNKSLKEKENSYKAAMKALQDEYYEKVGKICNLIRDNPNSQRLNKSEWQDEKNAAKRQGNARRRIKIIKDVVQKINIKKAEIIAHEQSVYDLRRAKTILKK